MTTPRIGLVLGAGGMAGTAFHSGVISALHEHTGFDARDADVVVGTSAGAMTAALVRAGLPPADFVRRMLEEPLSGEGRAVVDSMPRPASAQRGVGSGDVPSGRRRTVVPAAPRALANHARRPWRATPGHVAAAALPEGSMSTEPLRAAFDGLLPEWPAAAMWLCAVDVDGGSRWVMGKHRRASSGGAIDSMGLTVGHAVAASCAIPGYFAPVRVDDTRLVDGAVHSFCNADAVLDAAVDVVVVSAPMSSRDARDRSGGAVIRHMARRQLRGQVAALVASGKQVLVLHPTAPERRVMRGGMLDPAVRPATARATFDSVSSWLTRSSHPVIDSLRAAAR